MSRSATDSSAEGESGSDAEYPGEYGALMAPCTGNGRTAEACGDATGESNVACRGTALTERQQPELAACGDEPSRRPAPLKAPVRNGDVVAVCRTGVRSTLPNLHARPAVKVRLHAYIAGA